jgi:hypothetical protein
VADTLIEERVKRMLAAWIASGALKVATWANPKRKDRKLGCQPGKKVEPARQGTPFDEG